jgi:uncharacterized protein YhbP (UPF0306 family)
MTLRDRIVEYLTTARLMQVATSRADQPWACSVYFAFDADLNLYWISKDDRQHSKEIHDNARIAGTIVLPHTPGDKVRGIQFRGTAKKLEGGEAAEGMAYYAKQFGMKKERVDAILSGTDGHSCYRVTPSLYVLFDELNYPDAPRQEYAVS